jgi:hypothetical protein
VGQINPALRIWDRGDLPKTRRPVATRLPAGYVRGLVPISPDQTDKPSQTYAIKKRFGRMVVDRHGLPVPKNPVLMHRFSMFVRDWLQANVSKLNRIHTVESWLATTSFNEARKEQLRDAARELFGADYVPRHSAGHIDSFVKAEDFPCFKALRVINSRSDVFKAYCGPAVKSMEEEVYKLKWFIKHVPVPDRPALISKLNLIGWTIYLTDHTAFEAHMDPEIMHTCESQLYLHMLQDFPALARCLVETLEGENRGFFRSGLRFSIPGVRMSGDMVTSLGNGFTNLMAWLFFCHEHGLQTHGYVEGDDGLFAADKKINAEDVAQWFLQIGFELKPELHLTTDTASFCGIIACKGQLIKDPTEVLTRLGWTMTMVNAGRVKRWGLIRAKALSLRYEMPHCPITTVIARWLVDHTQGVKPIWVYDGFHKAPPRDCVVPEQNTLSETRQFYASLFGITVDAQLCIERAIKNANNWEEIANLLSVHIHPSPHQGVMASLYSV